MQCVILAGGRGTRMGHLTSHVPKAMIPVAGEPFLRRQLRLLADGGVTDALISTGYLGSMIEAEVEQHHPEGMHVRCVSDGPKLLGTAGALRRAADLGLLDEQFMMVYGDSYLLIDYHEVWDRFDPDRYSALMAVLENVEQLDSSNAVFEHGRVTLYRKGVKDPAALGMRYVDYGLSVFSRSALLELVPPDTVHDLAETFEELSLRSRLQGYEASNRFFEIGSTTGLAALELRLSQEHT